MPKKKKGVKRRVQRGGGPILVTQPPAPPTDEGNTQSVSSEGNNTWLCAAKRYFEITHLISAIMLTVIFIIGIGIEIYQWSKGDFDETVDLPEGEEGSGAKTITYKIFWEIFDVVMFLLVAFSWGMYYLVATRSCDSPYIIYLTVGNIISLIFGIIYAIKKY